VKADVLLHCIPIFPLVFNEYAIHDQQLICYIKICTEYPQQFYLYMQLNLTEECWIKKNKYNSEFALAFSIKIQG